MKDTMFKILTLARCIDRAVLLGLESQAIESHDVDTLESQAIEFHNVDTLEYQKLYPEIETTSQLIDNVLSSRISELSKVLGNSTQEIQ